MLGDYLERLAERGGII